MRDGVFTDTGIFSATPGDRLLDHVSAENESFGHLIVPGQVPSTFSLPSDVRIAQ